MLLLLRRFSRVRLCVTYTVYDSAEIPMDTTFSVSDDPTGGGKIPNDPCNFQEQALRLTR